MSITINAAEPRRLAEEFRCTVRTTDDGYRASRHITLDVGTLIARVVEVGVVGDVQYDVHLPGDSAIYTAHHAPVFVDLVTAIKQACSYLGAAEGVEISVCSSRTTAELLAWAKEKNAFHRLVAEGDFATWQFTHCGVLVRFSLFDTNPLWPLGMCRPIKAPESVAADPAAHDDQTIGAVA